MDIQSHKNMYKGCSLKSGLFVWNKAMRERSFQKHTSAMFEVSDLSPQDT
jgi:hypothetical protein